jgi:hypothetical protein
VNDVDPRLVAALRVQLSRRPSSAERVGWKFGDGEGERIGSEIAVGHRILHSVGEELRPDDRVITGLIVNCSIAPGDEVIAELGSLGRVRLRIA